MKEYTSYDYDYVEKLTDMVADKIMQECHDEFKGCFSSIAIHGRETEAGKYTGEYFTRLGIDIENDDANAKARMVVVAREELQRAVKQLTPPGKISRENEVKIDIVDEYIACTQTTKLEPNNKDMSNSIANRKFGKKQGWWSDTFCSPRSMEKTIFNLGYNCSPCCFVPSCYSKC